MDSLNSEFGLTLTQQQFGFGKQLTGLLNYRYEHYFSYRFSMLGGISFGLTNYRLDYEDLPWCCNFPTPEPISDLQPTLHAGIAFSWFDF